MIALTLLLCWQPALAQRGDRGTLSIEGVVSSVDSRGGTFTVQDNGTTTLVVVQQSTHFRGFDRLGDLRGQRVRADAIRLDDGRFLATEVRLRGGNGNGHGHGNGNYNGGNSEPIVLEPPGPRKGGGNPGQPGYYPPQGIRLNGLSNGMVVPANFNISGQTTPNSAVWVQITPSRQLIPGVISAQLSPWRVDGRSDPAGNFNLPVQAQNVPRGSRLDLQVNARDSYGNMQPAFGLSVTRQ